jgi:hypothetical protein
MDDSFKKPLQALACDFSISVLEEVLARSSSLEWTDTQRSDYLAARTQGLSIAQAECAVRLAEELRHTELQTLITRLAPQHLPEQVPFKRRGKPLKEEPEYKKKPKF